MISADLDPRRVARTHRRLEPLQRTAAKVDGSAIQCDVTDRDAIHRAFGEARAANGPIAFLIVNAGIGDSAPFDRTTRESWDRIIATNLTSAFDCAQAALPDLISHGDARMVFVASVAGLKGARAFLCVSRHHLLERRSPQGALHPLRRARRPVDASHKGKPRFGCEP